MGISPTGDGGLQHVYGLSDELFVSSKIGNEDFDESTQLEKAMIDRVTTVLIAEDGEPFQSISMQSLPSLYKQNQTKQEIFK